MSQSRVQGRTQTYPKSIETLVYKGFREAIEEFKMADRTGLEPATSGVTGRHSNQLNYRSVE